MADQKSHADKQKHDDKETQTGENHVHCQSSQEKTREARESRLTNATTEEQRANIEAEIKFRGSLVESCCCITVAVCHLHGANMAALISDKKVTLGFFVYVKVIKGDTERT